MNMSAASMVAEMTPLSATVTSHSGPAERQYLALSSPENLSPDLVPVGVKVTPLEVFDFSSTVDLPTL